MVHTVVEGQAMEKRGPSGGAVWVCHVVPPSLVVTIAEAKPVVSPTAMHVVTEGQATEVRSDNPAGADLGHPGRTSVGGAEDRRGHAVGLVCPTAMHSEVDGHEIWPTIHEP